MKLHEYQAKSLLSRMGIPVPDNAGVVTSPQQARTAAEALGGRVVLKAQVHTGGRGKAGGIRIAETPDEAERLAREMLGMVLKTHQAPQGIRVDRLLVEKPIAIDGEFYVGIVPDRSARRNALIVSAMGGMDIEAVADEHPEAIVREWADPGIGLQPFQARRACFRAGIPKDVVPRLAPIIVRLYDGFVQLDGTIAEINPLALLEDGSIVAADAKFAVDDNAAFRHKDLASLEDGAAEDAIEAEAHRRGIQYVRLDGTIGVIGNGAGLVMATLDEISRAGGKAANFLDVGGGAKAEIVRSCLELVLMNKRVRGVLINIFGGITRCDEVAAGILAAAEGMDINVPMVVRLAGTRASEGAALLTGSRFVPAESMQEAASRIVSLAGAAA